MPGAVVPLTGPGAFGVARQQRVHAGYETVVTRAVLRGWRRGRFGLRGGRGSVQAGRGGTQEAGGVGELVRAVFRLDRESCAVSSAYVCSSFSLPPEVPVIEHLLTVGVQRPVVSFTWRRNQKQGLDMDGL